MGVLKDSPLFTELEHIQQKIQGYSDSFPDVENLKSLSDRAGVLETRDGVEFIRVQAHLTGNLNKLIQAMADKIQAQNEKTRAEADWIRAQAELTRAQAELIRAQAELTRAQAEVTRAKANHDETGDGSQQRPSKSLWDKIGNIFKMLKEICMALYKFF
ncbi:uncharacterized protein LOC143274531 isoform X2 [Peromyscus maniculatus bairdii]|uniref:uncharacterized protein LOC143274531 isoform X2 n=1 Tax=Peromyscus maniculatus bairdii TaxID=230844 RepID=UPI003FD05C51